MVKEGREMIDRLRPDTAEPERELMSPSHPSYVTKSDASFTLLAPNPRVHGGRYPLRALFEDDKCFLWNSHFFKHGLHVEHETARTR